MNKTVLIVLGNRLNDDGSITKYQVERLEMALEIIKKYKPIKVILSGGIANPIPNKSEAEAMEEYLLNKGVDASLLIKEDKSHSTGENALYSVPIAKDLGANTIIVCTSDYHLADGGYNTVRYFMNNLKGTNISIMFYTKNTNM